MEMPVYLFTGFLDSGKTKFIQDTLEDKKFYDGERTLVILCEEGEEEYHPEKYPSDNVFFHVIDNISAMSKEEFSNLQKKYRIQRILIEYNGMWELNNLYTALPDNWLVYQELMFADASTILTYNDNMRNLVVDKLKTCEMIIFNRVEADADIMSYHKLVRAVNRSANIAYEYINGHVEYDEIVDPLPFDINAEVIEINDEDYAIWYRDLMEETDKYDGKCVSFKGIVAKGGGLPDGSFAVGRHIMTCCVEDISFGGLVAVWNKSDELETRDWICIKAIIKIEYNSLYKSKGPVLHTLDAVQTIAPKQEVAAFY